MRQIVRPDKVGVHLDSEAASFRIETSISINVQKAIHNIII